MQWVFDKRAIFGVTASHLSLVSSGAADVLRWTNQQLIDSGARRGAWGAAARPRGAGGASHRHPRAARHVLAGARAARTARRFDDPDARAVSRRRLDGYPPASDHRSRCPKRSPCRGGGTSVMRAIVVHYKELALKGRNRPWFVQILVQNLKNALKGIGVSRVRSVMGRIEIDLQPEASFEAASERIRHVFGIANFSLAGRGSHDFQALADAILAGPRRSSGAHRSASARAGPTSASRSRRRRSSARWAVTSSRRRAGRSTSMMPR